MNHSLLSKYVSRESNRRFVSENLKRCPLCGAVNAKLNCECFVCAWQGEFETHPLAVQEGLELLLDRCPELADLLLREPTWWERFCERVHTFRARFRRRVDTFA